VLLNTNRTQKVRLSGRLICVFHFEVPMSDRGQGWAWVRPHAQQPARRLATVSFWLLSAVLHLALFALLSATLPGVRGGLVGDPDGDFRTIGIYVGRSGNGGDGSGASATKGGAVHETSALVAPPPAAEQAVRVPDKTPPKQPEAGPDPLATSRPAPPVIGPGGGEAQHVTHPAASPIPTPDPTPSVNRSAEFRGLFGGSAGSGGARGSDGSTPFFGIWDRGARYVYVIDCSGSMYGHNAIRAAKDELRASLSTLKRTQQFQILFYNLKQNWLKIPGKTELRYFTATPLNQRLAEQFIAEVQPDDGTDHLPALKRALQLQPDVIFFLTDGGEPGLSPAELDEIRRLNRGRSRIHCVRFESGEEPDAAGTDFVRKLAEDNNGDYVRRSFVARPALAVQKAAAPSTTNRATGRESSPLSEH
jgi:hypothetical protein